MTYTSDEITEMVDYGLAMAGSSGGPMPEVLDERIGVIVSDPYGRRWIVRFEFTGHDSDVVYVTQCDAASHTPETFGSMADALRGIATVTEIEP